MAELERELGTVREEAQSIAQSIPSAELEMELDMVRKKASDLQELQARLQEQLKAAAYEKVAADVVSQARISDLEGQLAGSAETSELETKDLSRVAELESDLEKVRKEVQDKEVEYIASMAEWDVKLQHQLDIVGE